MNYSTFFRRIMIAVLLTSPLATMAQWSYLGSPGFSTGMSVHQSIAVSPVDGTPYVAYNDQSIMPSGKGVVRKFNGTDWVPVGTEGFTAGWAEQGSLAISNEGTLYFSYQDGGNASKVTVMTFDGTQWVNLGSAGMSMGAATYTSLAIADDGTVYLAYIDGGNGSKAMVKQWTGTEWANVGDTGEASDGNANYSSLALDDSGSPWIAFVDGMESNNATVKHLTGTTWMTMGAAGFTNSLSGVLDTDIAFGPDNAPYVTYWDPFADLKAGVRKLTAGIWENIGPAQMTPGSANFTTIVVDSDGTPYLTFMDGTSMASNGSTLYYDQDTEMWMNLGSVGFTGTGAGYLESAIDGNSILYVAYVDGSNENKTSVMSYTLCQNNSTPILNIPMGPCLPNDITISLNGNLNDDTDWVWHIDDCNGDVIGTGTSLSYTLTESTTFYVRGEGTCKTAADTCAHVTLEPSEEAETPVVTVNGDDLSTGEAVTYQWYLDGEAIEGADEQDYTATETGMYSVMISNEDGCEATSAEVFVEVSSVGEINPLNLQVFPTPFENVLQIRIAGVPAAKCPLNITDASGRIVYRTTLVGGSQSLMLDFLEAGFYTLTVTQDGNQSTTRIIKR